MVKQITSATPSTFIEWGDYSGKLLVVEPLDVEKDVKTVHGMSDAVRANVYVLTGPGESEDFEDVLIFPRVLQGQTRRRIGELVVGRLGQGEAKKGQNAPWILLEANEKDLKKAQDFVARKFVSSAGDAGADDDDFGDEADEAF